MLKVTFSKARLDKGVITQPTQDSDTKGQKPSLPSMRLMAGGNAGINDMKTQEASREEVFPSLLIIHKNC